jgi:hypothetical protein
MTGDAAAPRLNSGFEGVPGDAAAPAGAGALAPNVNPPLAVVGVAEGGAPNVLVAGIDSVGLVAAPNWKPDPLGAGPAGPAPFASPNLNPEDEAGVAVCAPNAGVEMVWGVGALVVLFVPNPKAEGAAPAPLFEPNPWPNPVEVALLVLLPKALVDLAPPTFPNPLDEPNPLIAGAEGFVSFPNENPLAAGFVSDAPFALVAAALNENPLVLDLGAGALIREGAEGAGAAGAAGMGANENPPMGFVAAGLGTAGVAPKGEGAAGVALNGEEVVAEVGAPNGELVVAGAADLGAVEAVGNANDDGLLVTAEVGAPNGEGAAVVLGAPKGDGAGAAAGAGAGAEPVVGPNPRVDEIPAAG